MTISEKKKDALTELVDMAGSQTDQPSNNGSVSTPTGEKIELGFDKYIRRTAKKIMEAIRFRKKQEREVLEHIVKKDYERKKTN